MATEADVVALAQRLADHEVAPDAVDWSEFTERQVRSVMLYVGYIFHNRQRASPKARRLFRSWLTREERRELTRSGHVTVTGSAGGRYRVNIHGSTHRIELHGRRWFRRESYCLHPEMFVPDGDIALAHYLLLRTDEPAFLAQANRHEGYSLLWNGDWLRRLSAARRERAQAA
jgi:hypothetical protein